MCIPGSDIHFVTEFASSAPSDGPTAQHWALIVPFRRDVYAEILAALPSAEANLSPAGHSPRFHTGAPGRSGTPSVAADASASSPIMTSRNR